MPNLNTLVPKAEDMLHDYALTLQQKNERIARLEEVVQAFYSCFSRGNLTISSEDQVSLDLYFEATGLLAATELRSE